MIIDVIVLGRYYSYDVPLTEMMNLICVEEWTLTYICIYKLICINVTFKCMDVVTLTILMWCRKKSLVYSHNHTGVSKVEFSYFSYLRILEVWMF